MKKQAPFRMQMIACDPYLDPLAAERLGVTLVSLDELLAHSDVLTIHARLTPQTITGWAGVGASRKARMACSKTSGLG